MSEPIYRLIQEIAAEFGVDASAVLVVAVDGTVPAIAPKPGQILIHASSFRRWAAGNPDRIAQMRTSGAGDMRTSGAGDMRTSGAGDMRTSGAGDMRTSGAGAPGEPHPGTIQDSAPAVINRLNFDDRSLGWVNTRWKTETPSKRPQRPLLNDSAENVSPQGHKNPNSAVAQHWRAVAQELGITLNQLVQHAHALGFRSNRIDSIRFRMLMDRVSRERAAAEKRSRKADPAPEKNPRASAWNTVAKALEAEGHVVYSRKDLLKEFGVTRPTMDRVLEHHGYGALVFTECEIDSVRAILAEVRARQDALMRFAKENRTSFGSLAYALRQAGFDWRITRLDDMPIAEWAEWKGAQSRGEIPRSVTFSAWLKLKRAVAPTQQVRQDDAPTPGAQQVRQDDAPTTPPGGGGGAATL